MKNTEGWVGGGGGSTLRGGYRKSRQELCKSGVKLEFQNSYIK